MTNTEWEITFDGKNTRAIQANMGEADFWSVQAEEWADRIMEDINLGIITAEVDG